MAYKINLSKEELKELESRMDCEKNPKIYKRLQCIRLITLKYKNIKIAEIVSVTKETITNWVKLYLNKGFDGLCSLDYDGRRVSKLQQYQDIIINLAKEGSFSIVKELKYILKDRYGLEVSRAWLSDYLKKNRTFLQKNSFNSRRKKSS